MSNKRTGMAIGVGLALVVSGCAQTPSSSRIGVAPGPAKSFSAFQTDQAYCTQYAQSTVAGRANQANRTAALGAGAGALGGAALGAAGGAIGGNAGAGTAIGALAGVVLGTAGGAYASHKQQQMTQRDFDQAYGQCMYSRGNNVQDFPPQMQVGQSLSPDDRSLVRSVQTELIRLHYLAPPADGLAGPSTISAITRFQNNAGMTPTGQASATLLARLQSTPSR